LLLAVDFCKFLGKSVFESSILGDRVLEVVVTFVVSYLAGSIPVGYLIVRRIAHVDIRDTGSGRSGGFNAFVVTKSRATGILVGVLDTLKGLLVVVVAGFVFPDSFLHGCIALFGAIAGHNYPIWTKFKGGRGLATAAGGMFILGFSYTVVWGVIWLVTKLILRRDILVSNITAIMFTPAVLWLIPWHWTSRLIADRVENWTFMFFACMLSMVLLLSHYDAINDVWKGSNNEPAEESPPQS
jgi:acyl phosphate:glycerol-3-phosphate acyltransferase